MIDEVAVKNITSLFKEHNDVLREWEGTDTQDMTDLSVGLASSVAVMIKEQRSINNIFSVITPYLRSAYGLGLNRGIGVASQDETK